MKVEPTIDFSSIDIGDERKQDDSRPQLAFDPTIPQVVDIYGRLSMGRFWLWSLVYGGYIPLTIYFCSYIYLSDSPKALFLIFLVTSTLSGLFHYSLFVRRLRDTGLSAWWLLLTFVPVLGNLFSLAVSVKRGNKSKNRFGPPNVPYSRFQNICVFIFVLVSISTGFWLYVQFADQIFEAIIKIIEAKRYVY